MAHFTDQSAYSIRCESGPQGLAALAAEAQAVVIIDVLSYSTTVDVAVARGAEIFPHAWKGESAELRAKELGASLASGRGKGGFSLSPASMLNVTRGQRIVLPSPNGSALSVAAGRVARQVVCASFRNVSAVAHHLSQFGTIAIIPAGERWPDDSLRPAIEDVACAGALIERLAGKRSPEAVAAVGVWQQMRSDLLGNLLACASGRQLIEMGYEVDVKMAADLDVSGSVPVLEDGRYVTGGL